MIREAKLKYIRLSAMIFKSFGGSIFPTSVYVITVTN